MYSMTTLEGTILALAVSAAATMLVLGVLRLFPRSAHAVTAGVECPLIRRPATALFVRDDWTRRFVAVASCSVLGGAGAALCRQECRHEVARSPRFM